MTNVDNTIQGQGIILDNTSLINQKNGVIDANFTNGTLRLLAPVTNSGLLEATGTNAGFVDRGTRQQHGRLHRGLRHRARGCSLRHPRRNSYYKRRRHDCRGRRDFRWDRRSRCDQQRDCNGPAGQTALTGIINNLGIFAVASATLSVKSATTIKGNALLGFIDLSNGGSLMGSPGAVLSNVSDTIFSSNGSGNIGGTGWELINKSGGQIRAFPGASLTIDLSGSGGFVSNAATIDALGGSLTIGGNIRNAATIDTFGGSLTIGGNIRNTSAGQILSEEATVTLESSGNIVGGTLSGVLGGV